VLPTPAQPTDTRHKHSTVHTDQVLEAQNAWKSIGFAT
jgi:hypothetical protein